mgnify:CR=1 FL=1
MCNCLRLGYALLVLMLWVLCPAQIKVQDTIYLMTGHAIGEKVIDTTFGQVSIHNPKKADRLINFEQDRLYMVRYANGYRRYYYSQDFSINNIFTREEMWLYMKGENDARRGFKARGALVTGTVFGVLGGMTGSIWGPVAPFGFMALSGITKIRIRHHTISNPRFVESDAYILGYERVARQKRKLKSLAGGGVGLVAGFIIYAVFHSQYPETIGFK